MRMKNRFCRLSKPLLGAVCLLSACGVTYSCSDDFDLDEKSPSFLGQSIYDELNAKGNFKTVIRLIDDLDYKSVLSQTGSKTLFVAPDSAYDRFYATNTWGVRKYDDLSTAQKRLLLNGSMLNNANVLEMLTTIQGPVKNLCLRQLSSMSATDSVPYIKWEDLPNNLNSKSSENPDARYWDQYRTQARGGIYMALDKTTPMLTHFLQGQMNEKKITPQDVSFILGLDKTHNPWNDTRNRSFMYNAEVIESDVTCMNGYYHVLDKVLVTPPNMAEAIHQNKKTSLFSAMLDRFSAPYYDATLTEEYKALHASLQVDSVYQKLYIAQRGQKGVISTDPKGNALSGDVSRLSYDPGWNAYSVDNSTKEQDMGAMFVPSDEAMKQYFVYGGGATLIKNYGRKPNTEGNLLENLYQIPQNIIVKLINNLMKESFNATVPSKYLSVMNSAQDQMFQQFSTPELFKAGIDTVMLANNGVVYVMNTMVAPPDYSSVSGPVLFDKGARVFNAVIHADDNFVTSNFANAPLRKFYSTYLLAMQSHFSLFVPLDKGLANNGYVDPIRYAHPSVAGNSNKRLFWTFEPSDISKVSGKQLAIDAKAYLFNFNKALDPTTATKSLEKSSASDNLSSETGALKKQMVIDMVDQHILVHTDDKPEITTDQQYYISRSGAPIFVKSYGEDAGSGKGMIVEGGFQKDVNSDAPTANDIECKVEYGYNMSPTKESYGNGHTYFISRPMQPTLYNVQVVYENQFKNKGYTKFIDLCTDLDASNFTNVIENIFRHKTIFVKDDEGNVTKTEDQILYKNDEWNTELKKYQIFSTSSERPTQSAKRLVRFFNNYRYSIFIPSDEAMQAAEEAGLPSIDKITAYYNENYDATKNAWKKEGAQDIAQGMVTCLVNFVKYHFCDQSYFVDKYTDSGFENTATACSDSKTNSFINLGVKHVANGLQLQDKTNSIVTVNTDKCNLMARDYELNKSAESATAINSSSYVAMHGLQGQQYLLFASVLKNGNEVNFENFYKTASVARQNVKRYRLKK